MKYLAVFLVFFVSGCATTSLSLNETKEYAHLSLDEFIGLRFPDAENSTKYRATYYTAYYTSANNKQLFRPTTEVTNYCKVQKGDLVRLDEYKGNPFSTPIIHPTFAIFETYSYARSKGLSDVVSFNSANVAKEIASQANSIHSRSDARSAFAETYSKQTYGVFECRLLSDGSKLWTIGITPIGDRPRKDALVPDGVVIEMLIM